MAATAESAMFPTLTSTEMELLRPLVDTIAVADGATVFQAGDTDLDLFVVERGAIEIQNPADNGAVIAVHHPGHFAGDIDLLTGHEGIRFVLGEILHLVEAVVQLAVDRLSDGGIEGVLVGDRVGVVDDDDVAVGDGPDAGVARRGPVELDRTTIDRHDPIH